MEVDVHVNIFQIHPSVFHAAYLTQGHRGPRELGTGCQPITRHNHTHRGTIWKCHSASNTCLWTGRMGKTCKLNTQRVEEGLNPPTSEMQGKHANHEATVPPQFLDIKLYVSTSYSTRKQDCVYFLLYCHC